MEGVTNKQLGERIHGWTRRVMDQWALDTRPAKQGGSSIHHGDSTMQTLGAVRTAPTGMRRDIIAAVKDQGKELATGLRGRNFFDVSEETHPLYHPGEGGKVDYKNKLATISELPSSATLKERVAAITKSTDISTAASAAADASPAAQARQIDLLNRARSTGGGEVLDAMGNPFDRSNPLRTTENIGALRKYVGLSFKGGTAKFAKMSPKQLAQFGLFAGVSVLGTGASAIETGLRTKQAKETGNITDWAQAGLSGVSLAADFIPVAGEVLSTPADAINVGIDTFREEGFKATPNPLEARTQQLNQSLQSNPKPTPQPKSEAGYETLGRLGSEAINELQSAGKQVMQFFGGALRMGSQAGF